MNTQFVIVHYTRGEECDAEILGPPMTEDDAKVVCEQIADFSESKGWDDAYIVQSIHSAIDYFNNLKDES